jgi:phage-related protein
LKEIVWIASTRRDMRTLPKGVRRTFGVALWAVQMGDTADCEIA